MENGAGWKCSAPPCEWAKEAGDSPADQSLWKTCLEIAPASTPSYLPFRIGTIDDAAVWLVDGDDVKVRYRMDYFEGGHDLVYHWLPGKQIWIDARVSPRDWPYNLFHEAHERRRMAMGWSYDRAHAEASRLERKLRIEAGQRAIESTRQATGGKSMAEAPDRPGGKEHEDEEVRIPHSAQHLTNLHEGVKLAHACALECGHEAEHPPVRKFAHKSYAMLGKMGNELRGIHAKEYPEFDEPGEEFEEQHPAAARTSGNKEGTTQDDEEAEREKGPTEKQEARGGDEGKAEKEAAGKKGKSMTGMGGGHNPVETGPENDSLTDHRPLTDAASFWEQIARYHPNLQERQIMQSHCKSIRDWVKKACGKKDDVPAPAGENAPVPSPEGSNPTGQAEDMDEGMKSLVLAQLDRSLAEVKALRVTRTA
jgi:hypothetical protein